MLEKLLIKHKPEGELRKDLEVATEVTRMLAGKELAGQMAAINAVSSIQDQMKADLCSLYKALDNRLVEIQNGQEKILTSMEQLNKTTDNLCSTAKDLETKVVKVTNTTDKIANSTMSYRNTLQTKMDSSNRAAVDPKVLNSIERRVKQILIKHALTEMEGVANTSLAELKDKANSIITDMDDYFCPEVTIVEMATRTKDGSILLTLNSREAMEWLREPENEYSFLKTFAEGAVMKDHHHNVLMQWTPISFDPTSREHHRDTKEANNIEELSIRSACWIKPPKRTCAGQTRAHTVFTFSSADVANLAICDGIDICGMQVRGERMKQEPI